MRARAWKAFLLAGACTVTLTACPPPEWKRAAAASQELARDLAQADTGGGTPPAGAPHAGGGETRIYVDATRSMAGFVGCSTEATEFDQVLDRMANDLGVTEVQLFGEAAGVPLVEQRALDRSVHCPDAFRRLQNPDHALYALMEADSTAGIHVYFSDGVQSDARAATPSPSVRALQAWLARGRALAILVFRSRFAGDAWSEYRGAWMEGKVDVPDRPFYVFVLASREEDVDATIAKLSPSLKPEATLRFPREPFTCGIRRKVGAQAETTSPLWALVPPSVHQQMAEKPVHVADYVCTIRDGYPLRTVEAALEATYRRWDGQGFGDQGALPQAASFTLGTPAPGAGESVTPLHGTVPRDQPGTLFGFYHLRLSPRPGALRPEVDSLSTESDADRAQFNRTYRFSWLVEHLVRSQFARGPRPASLFLTIQDGG